MNWPAVSILIPSSPGRSIERTIRSIRRQEYSGRLQIITGGDSIDAINEQAATADCDILAIQPAGDFYLPEAFVRSVAVLVREPALRMVSGCEVHLHLDGTTLRASALSDELIDPRMLMLGRSVPRQCVFFWRRAFEASGGLRTQASADPVTDLFYRLLHDGGGRFVPHHTAVHHLDASHRVAWDRDWLASMRYTIDSCESDPKFSQRFKLAPGDKLNLLRRWLLLEARYAGNEARVSELLAELLPGSDVETRAFLVRHGFLPMSGITSDIGSEQLRDAVNWSLETDERLKRVA